MADTAIAKRDETALTIATPEGQRALAAVREALGPGETLGIDLLRRAKVPAGGGKFWDLGDEAPSGTLEGVLILRQPVRAYWRENFAKTGGGTPPDCSSFDMEYGHGDNGTGEGRHACATCPLAEFGSAIGDDGEQKAGQACRQITRMFLLTQGNALPMLVSLPPSSYKAAQKYVVNQAAKNQPYYTVLTRIGLGQDKSADGITYSFATFEVVRLLTEDEQRVINEYRDGMVPRLSAVTIETNE